MSKTRFETSDTLPSYFKEIQKLNPLEAQEEKELAVKIKSGDLRALEKLVKHNLKLVVTIANRHIGQGVPVGDLIQEGNIGLWEAARRFEAANGSKFSNYAQLWIRKYINECVVNQGRVVRLPHNQEYERYKAKVKGAEVENLNTVEIDAPIGEDDDTTIGDLILNSVGAIEFEIEMDDIKFKAKRALATLKERDRKIVAEYFGIERDCPISTEVIAENHGMTQVRVCQIVKSSIEKLKTYKDERFNFNQ
jgi:RNA polymerase primary sigma factor